LPTSLLGPDRATQPPLPRRPLPVLPFCRVTPQIPPGQSVSSGLRAIVHEFLPFLLSGQSCPKPSFFPPRSHPICFLALVYRKGDSLRLLMGKQVICPTFFFRGSFRPLSSSFLTMTRNTLLPAVECFFLCQPGFLRPVLLFFKFARFCLFLVHCKVSSPFLSPPSNCSS